MDFFEWVGGLYSLNKLRLGGAGCEVEGVCVDRMFERRAERAIHRGAKLFDRERPIEDGEGARGTDETVSIRDKENGGIRVAQRTFFHAFLGAHIL